MDKYILEAKNIHFAYGTGENKTSILHDVSLSIREGEILAIKGASGSGKTTLLHLLACLMSLNEGKIIFDNVDISELDEEQLAFFRNQEVGIVFQKFYLLPRATVLNNILLPANYPSETAKITEAKIEKAKNLAKLLGIDHRLNYQPNELSGGEQQRVAICRALMNNCRILFADEPTGNLDSHSSQNTLDLFKKLNTEINQTIVIITHDENVAKQAHRIVDFKDGCITEIEEIRPFTQHDEKNIGGHFKPPKRTLRLFPHMIIHLIPQAVQNIFRNKLRTFLTMLGIIIGISSMLILITLGQFARQNIIKAFATMGTNTILIWGVPNDNIKAGSSYREPFSQFDETYDLIPLKSIFPQIQFLSPVIELRNATATYGGNTLTQNPSLYGIGSEYFDLYHKPLIEGYYLKHPQIQTGSDSCVVGYEIYKQLFKGVKNALGKMVTIRNNSDQLNCTVVGVLAEQLSASLGPNPNYAIYVSYKYVQTRSTFFWFQQIHSFMFSVANTQDVENMTKSVTNFFKVKYGSSGQFVVSRNAAMISLFNQFFQLLTALLAMIASISLIVGGVGIANMMLASISERLKEIGIIKAFGATDISIRFLFIIESLVMCLIAGILGLLIGFTVYESLIALISLFIKQIPFEIYLSWPAMSVSIISMVIVGILSGLFPALKAEKIDVVQALQSE